MAAFIKEYFYLYGMVCFMWHGFDVLFMRDQSIEMPHKLFLFGLMPFAYFSASMAKSLRKAQRSRDIMAEIFRD